ncbi:uncharacterized protein BJ171DRAFT_221985 [Polychytrium aggregatum]|uniref:uncharacterized protein n=1 Tax=Polychytrium aggregatum TaxID=110093 RepID=UPI0022FE9CDD|nr:uncharacterized protein BJ171DRAFT_221985 [Polychytrium aggregatum]KAI9197516.1 hypothetical protein BJ171DRAFT_221985 [Polychytrium aggregatum]
MSGSGDMDMMDVDQVNDIIHTLRAHPLVPGTGHGVVLLDSVDVHPECVIVIDTNYLISDIGFVSEVLKCANHFFTTILIPKAVVRELDALKSNPGCPVSKEARRANDFLLNALQTKTPYLRGQTLEQESFGQVCDCRRICCSCRALASIQMVAAHSLLNMQPSLRFDHLQSHPYLGRP